MIPIAHVIARRRRENKRLQEIRDQSPHKVRPLVGLRRRSLGAPLPTSSSGVGPAVDPADVFVDVSVTKTETTYKILCKYAPISLVSAGSKSTLDFYFPVSECGRLIDIRFLFNKQSFSQEAIRAKEDGTFITATQSREEFLALNENAPPKPGTKATHSIYYVRMPFVPQQLLTNTLEIVLLPKLEIFVQVRVRTIEKVALERYRVLFPLLCLPISPSSFRCEMDMPTLVRRVRSSNSRHHQHLNAFLNNRKAEFSLIFTPENPLHLEDYLFDVDIELGDPIVAECMDPVSVFILVTALGMLVFYLLTRDLLDV